MFLKELREKWERGLEVRYEHKIDNYVFLVVLEGNDGYHAHRYTNFSTSPENWDMSADGQNVTANQIFAWLGDPGAIT